MANVRHKGTSHKPGSFYSTLSMTLVLFLLGAFAVFILNTDDLLKSFKETLDLVIELKTDASRDNAREFMRKLEAQPCIKPGSSDFVSKEEGFSFLKKQMGQDAKSPSIDNPLFDVIKFNLIADCLQKDSLAHLKKLIKENPIVNEVYFPEELVGGIAVHLQQAGKLFLILSIIFIIIAIIIIHNTVKLALYANRFTIKTMEMVGASRSTIKRPFLLSAVGIGLWAGLWSSILLIGILMYLSQAFPDFIAFTDTLRLIWILSGMIITGVILSILITWFVINRYIGRKIETLY